MTIVRTPWGVMRVLCSAGVAAALAGGSGLLPACTERQGGDWIGVGGDGPCGVADDDAAADDDADDDAVDDDDGTSDDADGDGYTTADGDCDDGDPDVHPGQTLFFDTPSNSGSFDYDCDGVEEPQTEAEFDCPAASCVLIQEGWMDGVPACGNDARWGVSCAMESSCTTQFDYRRMACR